MNFTKDNFNELQTKNIESTEQEKIVTGNDFDDGSDMLPTEQIIAYENHSFEYFQGKHFEEIKESIRTYGFVSPIYVCKLSDASYEIIDGHYRVAAARELNITKIPARVSGIISDDEDKLFSLSRSNPLYILHKYGIDILEEGFTSSESYISYANNILYPVGKIHISLGEYIERFLLDPSNVAKIYRSKHCMGYPYALSSEECELDAVSNSILEDHSVKLDLNNVESDTEEPLPDTEYDGLDVSEIRNILTNYPNLIKKYLNIDLSQFDHKKIRNRQEIAKFIYFLYTLKHSDYKKINIFDMLKKPSMENIYNPISGMESYNGQIIQHILQSIRKELSIHSIELIEDALSNISLFWDFFLSTLMYQEEEKKALAYSDNCAYECDFSEIIQKLRSKFPDDCDVHDSYNLSPLEMFYLRIMQHQYIGQVSDILKLNNVRNDSNYEIPNDMIPILRDLYSIKINYDEIDSFIYNYASFLALIIFQRKCDASDNRKIREKTDKVKKLVKFCDRARPLDGWQGTNTALFIVSCLQTIMVDCQNEVLEYSFQGYENHMKHRPHVQAALKGEKTVLNAVKIYLVRKIMDHWYENIGYADLRLSFREVENACDNILINILSETTLSKIEAKHKFYSSLVDLKEEYIIKLLSNYTPMIQDNNV